MAFRVVDSSGNIVSEDPDDENLTDSSGIVINPAREDGNLANIKAKTDNLDVLQSTRLSEIDFDTRIGEVQIIPTAYTVLARLKDIGTQLVTQVRGLFDSAGNAITSHQIDSSRALDVNVIQNVSSTGLATDLGLAFGVAFDFLLVSAGNNNPVFLLKNPAGSGKRVRIIRINVGVTVQNVAAIWRVFYNPTVTNNGTAITPRNLNIGGASNPATAVETYTGSTVTADGTSIFKYESGQNTNSTEIVGDALFILNPGTSMLFTGDPLSNNRNSVLTIYWTEVA